MSNTDLGRRWRVPFAALAGSISAFCLAEGLQPTSPWFREFSPLLLTVAVISASAGAVLTLTYGRATFSTRTGSSAPTAKRQLPSDADSLIASIDESYDRIGISRALHFSTMIMQPYEVIDRISERLDARISSSTVTSSYLVRVFHNPEFDHPDDGSSESGLEPVGEPPHRAEGKIEMIFPLFMQNKGQLENNLRFLGDSGERISSLSQESTVIYTASVIRYLISFSERESRERYLRELERDVVHLLATTEPCDKGCRLTVDGVVDDLVRLLQNTTRPALLDLIVNIIAICSSQFPVCVSYRCGSSEHDVLDQRLRFTVERSIPATKLSTPDTRDSFVVRTQEYFRNLFGIVPTRFEFALANADRCASYHLQMEGPAGSFLAKQNLIDLESGDISEANRDQYTMLRRHGQSFSHLYIRNGENFGKLKYVNLFYEVPPGSIAPSTLSAVAAALLIWMAFFRALGMHGYSSDPTDMVAVLFAFPAILGVWAGFDKHSIGERLIAKVTRFLSIFFSVAAAFLYLMGGIPGLKDEFQWFLLALFASLNALGCCTSWVMRSRVHREFSRRSSTPERSMSVD